MVMLTAIIIIAAISIAIYIIIEIKRLKHKLFAVFLIFLLLFGYLSFLFVFRGQEVDFKTVSGLTSASKIYYSWLVSVAGNMKSITSYAIQKDWGRNESAKK